MPKNLPLKRQSILPRLDGVRRDVEKLSILSRLPLSEFQKEDNFIKAQFYLRQALEGVFHIGSHILSRLPGGRVREYKEIALKLGEFHVVDPIFSKNQLKAMAGYRNRLTHFYADITPQEIYLIVSHSLDDFNVFLASIAEVFKNPEKFNLSIE